MDEEKIKQIYGILGSKFDVPDYNTFKDGLLKDPAKRQGVYDALSEDYDMGSFGGFEANIFGNVPDEPKNPEREPWYKVVGELFNISQPEKMSSRVGELFSSILTGAEQMFSTDAVANYAETLVAPLAKHLIKNDYDKRDIFDPTGLGHILEEPVEKKTEQEKEIAVKQVEKREHQLFTKLANDKFDIEQKYVDMGFIDREHTNVLRDQGYSLGLNLPFVAIGGGAMKLGFSGIATATQFLGYPLFTIAEANSFAGEVYSDTAKKDKDGRVIEGTGDIRKAEVGQIFGTIAGMFEFAGPHQALSIFKESTGTLAKELSNKEVAKKLLKIMSVEGIEEGVYQGPIEQLTKMGLNLQDKFSFEQSLDEFVGGSVGGLLLGGFSVSSNVNRLQELKDFAEKDVIPKIDRMEKAGIISKEKADNYRETANVLVNTPVDELQPVVEKINESLGDMRMEAGKVLKDMQTGYNVYDTILKSDLEDPYARYDTAIPDKTFRNEFVKAIESSPEFQTLQKELGKQNPNLQVADLVKLTHKQLQDSNGQEKTKVLTDARGRLLDLSLMAGKQLELYDTLSDGKSVSTTGNEDEILYTAMAYHGGPHDITKSPEGKFSLKYIGTGEGAQAYGHGLYFSSQERIAKYYAEQLGGTHMVPTIYATPEALVDLETLKQQVQEAFYERNIAQNAYDETYLLDTRGSSENVYVTMAESFEEEDRLLKEGWTKVGSEVTEEGPRSLFEKPFTEEDIKEKEKLKAELDMLSSIAKKKSSELNEFEALLFTKESRRNLYKVKLWEGKEQNLLDWNDNISLTQTKQILDQLDKEGINYKGTQLENLLDKEDTLFPETGINIYHALWKRFAELKGYGIGTNSYAMQEASAFLNRAGFDGIVYQGDSSGVQNYVVFDDSAISIEEHILFNKEVPNLLYEQAVIGYPKQIWLDNHTPVATSELIKFRDEYRAARKIGSDKGIVDAMYNDYEASKAEVKVIEKYGAIFDKLYDEKVFKEYGLMEDALVDDYIDKLLNEIAYKHDVNQLSMFGEESTIPSQQNASQTSIQAPQQAKSSKPSQDTKVKRITSLKQAIGKMRDKGFVDEETKEFSDWLFDKIPDLEVVIAEPGYLLGKDASGKDIPLQDERGALVRHKAGSKIILNISKIGKDYNEAWKTLVHEGSHEFLFESLDTKSKLFNRELYNSVDALMKEIKLRFDTDQKAYYTKHKQDLDRIFNEPQEIAIQEFAAYMLGRNSPALANWAKNTPVSNNSKSTYLSRFFDIIKRFFAKNGSQSPTFMDALETIMNQHFGSPAKIDYWDMVFDDTSGIYDSMEEGYDKFDKIQDPDNTIDNPRMIRAIGKQIANELGETATDYISYVKSMSFEQFKGRLFKLSSWKKSAEAYYTTQNFDFSSGEFMQKLAIQLYEYATNLEKHPTVRLVTRFDSGAEILDSTIEELGDTYRNKDNAIKSGWRNKIKLSERIPILEQLLGAKLELVYLDDEKYVKDGVTTWNAINEINFNLPKRNETYVRLLAKHNIIFPGTWSDKGTVVGLRIKEGEVNTADIMKIYDEKISKLKEQGLKFEGLLDSDSPEVNRAMAVRLLIEDLRLGGSIQNGQLQTSLFNPEDKSSYDLIKILKRPTEVAPMVSTIQTADRIADVMKGDPIGIEKGDYGLEARTVIFNAIPEKGKWIETFEFKGQSIQVDMHDVFVNELGTPTTDGVVYYLEEGFGKVYRKLHGVINPGAIKAWIANSTSGNFSSPLYIKSSIQKQSTKDFLGQWMKRNNIALLVSSESAKVNKVANVTNFNEPDKINVFNIPFSNIYRDKETGVVKKSVRGSIQSMGANLDTKNNPFFVGDYTAYQTELLNSLLDEFDDQMINMDGATILQELKEVALNSTSQYEQSLARIILDIAYTQADENVRQSESVFFIDSKEEKITRNITNQRIAKDLGGLFHEPYFAEILKSRISKALHKVANYKGSSTWAVLRPDLGFAEMSKIEALWDALMAKEQTKRREELPTLYKERENLLGTGNQELIESVDKDIQRIESSIASDTEEIRAEVWKKIVNYIDIKSGRLKENVSYISEDIAEKHHIAPLDDTILTVVPSDGMIAQQANVTIPVSTEYMDAGSVTANSEHTQTKDGKDFDVDKGQIRAFNSQYTTKKAWNGLVKTIRDTQEQHKKLTLKYYQSVLKDKSLTEKDIYSKPVQLKFMQVLSGSPHISPNSYYDPRGIFGLLDMFAKDIGGVINDRKDITTKDQLGFTSSFSFDGKIYNFNTAQSNLPLYYLIAMRLTNDAVDKPTNENGLYYDFSELKLAEYQYGLKLDDTPANGMAIAGMKKVDKFLFRYATRFTSGGNLDERGAERGLAQDLSYAYTQQEIWKLLNGSRADKRRLAGMYETWYVAHNPNQKASTAQTFIRMGQEYIINSTIQNPTGSPLMNSVNRLPLHRIPNLGTSERVYRVWQYLISQSINKKHSDIAERVSEKWDSAIKEFRSPVNRQYVTNFLLTSENPRLHLIKAITIGFILPVDQRLFKEGSEAEGKFLTDIFNKANEIVYPKLIQQLFQGKTFIFNRTSEASFDVKEGKIILSKAPYNGLKVTYRKADGEVTEWKSGYDLLSSTTTEARGVRNVLFSSKGIFSTYGNRYKLSQMISFGRNIPMQGRLDYVKDFLGTVMPQMTIEEKELFWHSLLGYPDPSDSYGVREAPTKNTEKTLKDAAAKIKTPMNLVPFSVTENPDQKTLLQIAELVEDKSGKDFLNEYARTATQVYPGLGIDKAIEIKSEIDNGGMSAPTILFTKADNRYNDEAYDATKAFNNIYDIFQKSEVYVEGEDLGVYPRISGRIGILTKEDVTESIAPLPTKQAWKPKYESVALRKARMLLQMMKTFNSRLDRSHTIIDHSIQNLRGTGQSKEDIISRINLLSEKFFGIDFFVDNVTGKINYLASNGATYNDETIDKMLADYNVPPEDYGYYKSALELRKIYDHWNPQLAKATVNYLTYLKNHIPEGFMNTPIIDSYIDKWTKLGEQFQGMKGKYFPRMYKEGVYDGFLEEWALWNVINEMNPEAEAQEIARLYREARASGNLSEEVQTRVNREITTLSVDNYDGYVHTWQRERVIPEWLAKGKYITDTMDMHSKHMIQFQNAVVNDITTAEALLYEHNASINGQTKEIISQMLQWYGNMTTDKNLKAEKVTTDKIKSGNNVAFYYRQNNREKRIRGVVNRVEGDSVYLEVDPEVVTRNIQRNIQRYERTHDNIISNPNIRPEASATSKQMAVIQNLVDEGYLDAQREYTILDANDAIVIGLRAMLEDQANWGRFRKDRIYVKQYQGTRGVSVPNKVERSLMNTPKELRGSWKDADANWQRLQLVTANMFLGNPGAAIRNYNQAMYRIVQDFGWLRYFNIPGKYYQLLDKLPADVQKKLPFSEKVAKRTNEVYGGIRKRANKFTSEFLLKAKEGTLSEYHKILYPIINGSTTVKQMDTDGKLKVVEALAAQYLVENSLTTTKDIGNAYVKEVGAQGTQKLKDDAKSILLIPFLSVEGKVRRDAAFLYAYKAVFYDNVSDLRTIKTAIEKGVALANSLYDQMERKLIEGDAKGKFLAQFSQFNTFQWSMFKLQIEQAKQLGQLRDVNGVDDIIYNLKSIFAIERTIDNPDGTKTTFKIGDTVDPLIPARLAKYLWQDTIASVYNFAFPGLRVGNPVNQTFSLFFAMVINMIRTGELPDEWDFSDWLFGLVAFKFGLGITLPAQLFYNAITGKKNIMSTPKMVTATWDIVSDQFSSDRKNRISDEWYIAGQGSKLLTGMDLTPHSRKYYSDEQNKLTKTAFKKVYKPLVGEIDLGPLTIPVPSDNLLPIYNLSKYLK